MLSQDHPLLKDHQRDVLGTQVIRSAPLEYWRLSARQQLHISPTEWSDLCVDEKAKAIAWVQIHNMTDVVKNHIEHLRSNQERLKQEQ